MEIKRIYKKGFISLNSRRLVVIGLAGAVAIEEKDFAAAFSQWPSGLQPLFWQPEILRSADVAVLL